MGEFPSGQRGQTVNLLLNASVVRIHLPPPEKGLLQICDRPFLCPFSCEVRILTLTMEKVVSRVMRKFDLALVEICRMGAGYRPLVTFQRTGRKGSRAAIRRLSCP